MDTERFDTLARSLTAASSRRTMLGLAIGGALAPLLSPADTGAKKGKKKGRGKKKRGNLSPPPPPPPPPSGCPPGTEACGGTCVNTSTDPFNCGGCGKRCQIHAICQAGTCTCARGSCASAHSACCPASYPSRCICRSGPGNFTDSSTCAEVTCTPERQCVGPSCQACCAPGSTCDPSTGTCLR